MQNTHFFFLQGAWLAYLRAVYVDNRCNCTNRLLQLLRSLLRACAYLRLHNPCKNQMNLFLTLFMHVDHHSEVKRNSFPVATQIMPRAKNVKNSGFII